MNSFLEKLESEIEANLTNEQFGVEDLASRLGMSRSSLHRKVQEATGKSVSQFIREYRLQMAMDLLQQHQYTAAEIAYKVGFGSPTYFSKSFHDFYGFPPGEARKRSANTGHSPTPNPALRRRQVKMIFLFLVVVIAISAFLWFRKSDTLMESGEAAYSIMVMPFENRSNLEEQQYFTDGVMDAVLTHLAGIDQLRVVSRTTSMRYRDTHLSIPEIAEELQIRYVLEGGVQEEGGMVRINVQLIDALTDKNIWSEQYDRSMENIFVIQSDIARSIAQKLNAQLSEDEIHTIEYSPTTNTLAYKQYLRGKFMMENSWSLDNLEQSRQFLQEAIELDPEFAEAYIWLGISYQTMGTWYGNMSGTEAMELARPYFQKAEAIDPDNPLLLSCKAIQDYIFEWDFEGADTYFTSQPASASVGFMNFHLDLMLHRFDKVIEECEQTLQLDPFTPTIRWNLAYAYYFTGDHDKIMPIMEEALSIDPKQEAYYDHFGNLMLALGEYEKAIELLKTGLEISSKPHASMVAHLAIAYNKKGNSAMTQQLMGQLHDRVDSGEKEIKVFLAHAYAGMGDRENAFHWLEQSYQAHEVDLIWLPADPNLLTLSDDLRYHDLLYKMGFPVTVQHSLKNLTR